MPNTELALSWLIAGCVAAVDHCHLGQDPTGSGHTGPIIALRAGCVAAVDHCHPWQDPTGSGNTGPIMGFYGLY